MALTRCTVALAGTAITGIAVDQATKALVTSTIEGKRTISVVGRLLTINVSRNTGAAFSFAPAATIVFTGLAVVVAGLIITRASRLVSVGWAVALGLLLAGSVGNLVDRLLRPPGIGRGAVVDFIDLQHFATFNVADSCLTCGVVLSLIMLLRDVPLSAPPAPAGTPASTEHPSSTSS
jgi:signal peptidase II